MQLSMDTARYFLAVLVVVSFPAVLPVWLLIHPFARFWRRRGPAFTYAFVLTFAGGIGFVQFRLRASMLRGDFGFSFALTIMAVALYAVSVTLEVLCRRHLKTATLIGLPEVSEKRPNKLLSNGIYGRIRHPRYLSVMVGVFAFALFINYLSVYMVAIGTVPLLYLVVIFEERELVERFGDEYRKYMKDVPRFIPNGGR